VGYVRPTLRLVFDEEHHGDLAGLEVRMKRLTIDQLVRVSKLRGGIGDEDDAVDKVAELVDAVAAGIIGWNLEEEGAHGNVPVPPTAENLRVQDFALIQAVTSAWMDAAVGVSAPLVQPSPAGEPFPEESIPMDVPSTSLAS
jgi:hypothetical protein